MRIKGFSLLEILIVVVILSILASIGLPMYIKSVARSREGEGWSELAAIRFSQLRYYAEYDEVFADRVPKLDIENPAASSAPLFTYRIVHTGNTDFTAVAEPKAAKCPNCRILCLDHAGNRGTVPPAGSCP